MCTQYVKRSMRALDDYKHFGRGWSRRNTETLHQAMEMVEE